MKEGWDTEKLRDLCRHIGSPLAVTADDVLGRIQTSRVREVARAVKARVDCG